MIKITGLDELSQQIENAKKVFEALDGHLTTVNFNPSDPGSIEVAIQQINTIIDEKVGQYANNPFVGPLAQEMKEKYREVIIEKAAAERLKGDDTDV